MLVLATTFCKDSANIWQLVGTFLLIFKIVIPIIIILLGSIDLGKAVISSDEKEIKKSAVTLAKRFIAGIVIFFIPTLVGVVFNLLTTFKDEIKSDYNACIKCIVSPFGDENNEGTCGYYVKSQNIGKITE